MCDHCSKVTGQKGYGGQVTCKCEGDKKEEEKDSGSNNGGCCGKKAREVAGGCCKSGCCKDEKEEKKKEERRHSGNAGCTKELSKIEGASTGGCCGGGKK